MSHGVCKLLLAVENATLVVAMLLWGVLAHEKPHAQHPITQAPAGLEALRLTTVEITFVQAPLVMDVPRSDPVRDGRWWMVLYTKHGWERRDGPYLTLAPCVNDVTDAYAQQYPRWQFDCAEEV